MSISVGEIGGSGRSSLFFLLLWIVNVFEGKTKKKKKKKGICQKYQKAGISEITPCKGIPHKFSGN